MNLKPIREDDRYLWILCPSHNDVNTPNLCVNKTEINGKPKGYGYCYACGYRIDIDPREIDKMSKRKTVCRKTVPIDWKNLTDTYVREIDRTWAWVHLAKEWNVKPIVLNYYNIGFDTQAFTAPMKNENGEITGVLRRFPDGRKICVNGSQLGLFMPNKPITQPVVVEGVSDAAMITELGFWGLGLPSASFGHDIAKKFLDNQNYSERVLIIADADAAGKKSAKKMRKVLTSRCKCVIMEPEIGKDLRDFVDIKGKEYVKKWIEENL